MFELPLIMMCVGAGAAVGATLVWFDPTVQRARRR